MNNTSDIETILAMRILVAQTWLKNARALEKLVCGTFVWTGRAHRRPRSNQKIVTDDGEFEAKTVVIATGSNHSRSLNVPGEEELNSRGVSTVLFVMELSLETRILLVVGGGDSCGRRSCFFDSACKNSDHCPSSWINCVLKSSSRSCLCQ